MRRVRTLLTALLASLLAGGALAADFAVIVNKDNANAVDKALVQKIYLAKTTQWPGGGTVAAADLPEADATRAAFTSGALGKTVSNVKALWAEKVFSGKALPPKVFDSSAEVKKFVAGNKNAIGYVDAADVDGTVKAVLK